MILKQRTWPLLLALFALLGAGAQAHGPNDPPHQKHSLGDFKLESGEVIRDFDISYTTHGTLNAKTLILAGEGDLLNPEADARDAANHIADARYVTIKPRIAYGHLSGAGARATENEFQNSEIAKFLDVVTDNGARIK